MFSLIELGYPALLLLLFEVSKELQAISFSPQEIGSIPTRAFFKASLSRAVCTIEYHPHVLFFGTNFFWGMQQGVHTLRV